MNEEQQVQRVLREVPPPDTIDPQAPPQVVLHADSDPRSVGLIVLSTLAILAILKWASAFFIPLMLGFVFYYALSPIVEALARVRIPRAVTAGVLILAILAGSGATIYSMADDANDLINSLPSAAQRLRTAVQERFGKRSALDTVQKAATELEKTAQAAKKTAPPSGVQRVIVERPPFDLRDHLWTGTVGLVSLIGQITVVTFLSFFLLVSGDTFRRKLVKITGPGLSEKKLTVQALDEINVQIQRYMLVNLLVSLGEGLLITGVFTWLGIKHAAVWGVVAGVLNLVPYVGSALFTVAAVLVVFVQSGEVEDALLVGGICIAINTIKGNLLVPWLTSKASRMNAVSVFIGVLFWGWLWGVWGLLLGIPIMMVIKAVCDRVDHLKPVGELLGT
ncbi:AI-2E family transporter [Ramlibacter sp. MMS24-I3-19]|uniref:AI-2E family transporter n=1 Tax=Ramlibacter sp. MMS24-I3-19 TaxID=3416606 RepID=UPI003D00332B